MTEVSSMLDENETMAKVPLEYGVIVNMKGYDSRTDEQLSTWTRSLMYESF